LHVYEARLATSACVYYRADSVTVTPAGALIVSVEMPPIEALVDEEESTLIENPPVAIFAPGQWQSCVLVTDRTICIA
jgi:hypothetical protein